MMEFGESSSTKKNRATYNDHGFMDFIFSWTIEDILNEDMYKEKVGKIEKSFQSIDHYRQSFVYPLLEETRAELCSSFDIIHQAPFAQVIGLEEAKPFQNKLYNLKIDGWKNKFTHVGEVYKNLPGDVLVLVDYKPEAVNDLQRFGRFWRFVSVVKATEDEFESDSMSFYLKVKASKEIDPNELRHKSLYLVFLTNISSNRRIWQGLHMPGNLKLLKKILCTNDEVEESCSCSSLVDALKDDSSYQRLKSELNESQNNAIFACLESLNCSHNSTVKLIWGPPGTGKTKTLATLLSSLIKMKYRILVCAPTNVAIKEVASRVLSIFRESGDLFCSMGDMLLFGNNERLKIGEDIEDIYLDHRIQQLTECFAPYSGLNSCLESIIRLLENSVSMYHASIENELERENNSKSFLKFLREKFPSKSLSLKSCVSIFCTHVSMSVLSEDHDHYLNIMCLNEALESFEESLFQNDLLSGGLEHQLYKKVMEFLSTLRTAKDSFGRLQLVNSYKKESIRDFCFKTSSLIFCTTSGSYKLHSVAMKPLNLLVIDEAAQLKECESIIPMLLKGISQAILVGDECQLPSMVRSNVSNQAGFGRSLFERLSSLGLPKNLLSMQHRMHPEICLFPNSHFYFNKIRDAPNVRSDEYRRQYLPGPMFGPYSFINIVGGKEEFDDSGRSFKNVAEVAVVMTILKNLHKAWLRSLKEKLCIGIVSPYAGQVVAIQKKLGKMYENHDGFYVNVKSIDGFQGGEQDVVILSTVRTNNRTTLEFISSPQRTNVALTRARLCLWILGNETALTNKDNVWKSVVLDAKNRKCFFNADQDDELAKAILDSKIELDQLNDLLDTNSVLFRDANWKVHFTDKFLRSFKRLRSEQSKKMVIDLLKRLSSGWRPKIRTTVELKCENSSQILKQFKVESRYLICSIEIVKYSRYIQVLKIWDLMPLEDISQLAKRLDNVFSKYSEDYINRCKQKGFYGNEEFPMSWPISTNIQKFKSANIEIEAELNVSEDTNLLANPKDDESILLMKYCSSRNFMLCGSESMEMDLPYEFTNEQREIILFQKSTFVLGRSGTGKTSVLTAKLIQNEKLHNMAVEAVYGSNYFASSEKVSEEISSQPYRPVLRQLFVTLSLGQCQEIKHHISLLKRSLCQRSMSASVNEDIGDESMHFQNIPNSFSDIPSNSYPLAITFRKFLLMLDATLRNSYFQRFCDVKGKGNETSIWRKEVNYEKFDSSYWPHLNSELTKKLDSYQVFTEIMSHIKGSIEQGRLSLKDYCTLSENRVSNLSIHTRGMIYEIFQSYEKLKIENGEFDLADVVIDIHSRLRTERYKGDEMNFVFIDEVQDFTMAQIALFKHICSNVKEGFVFCGDTAQTIGRGIDFRFQDVRSLFYKKFVLESKWNHEKKGKGLISDIFQLSQNFRTSAEVLRLSESIIELLCHFFPHSVDLLKVESSLINGEAPFVLESSDGRDSIAAIFENGGGFGANQVILVRDDSAKENIMHIVGNKALVLTILECKGLEFQDVLLYNFFATSPLKRKLGVIYHYMKEKHLLDSRTELKYSRSFEDTKYNVLCSELKQLYVAVTRTKKRLWIIEDVEEYCKPMFDYWKKKNLVQFKNLTISLAETMRDVSNREDWRTRGIKLYYQSSFDMAKLCFERAEDSQWLDKCAAACANSKASSPHGRVKSESSS